MLQTATTTTTGILLRQRLAPAQLRRVAHSSIESKPPVSVHRSVDLFHESSSTRPGTIPPYGVQRYHFTTDISGVTANRPSTSDVNTKKDTFKMNASKRDTVYLHVSPDGDWWTGYELFAAKHLQPDYVKSVALPRAWLEDADGVESYIGETYEGEELEELMQEIYNTGALPERVLERMRVKR